MGLSASMARSPETTAISPFQDRLETRVKRAWRRLLVSQWLRCHSARRSWLNGFPVHVGSLCGACSSLDDTELLNGKALARDGNPKGSPACSQGLLVPLMFLNEQCPG